MRMMKEHVWMFGALVAAVAGWTDWRSHRIPNWLTVPGFVLGIAVNSMVHGWQGAKESLLGAGLGLGLLLPFVLLRSLGAGDWKLAGAIGAWVGPQQLVTILMGTVLLAGLMALVLVIWKQRVRQTLHNLWYMLASLFTFHLPGPEVSLDSPQSLKVPFGVALAAVVVLYTAGQAWAIIFRT